MNVLIKISDEELPAFLAYLGLGTLVAIRNGSVPVETGIWTLARPRVWEFLLKKTKVPKRIIRVYRVADELSAIKSLLPDKFDTNVGKLMDDLEKELAKLKDPTWLIEWGIEPAHPASRRTRTRDDNRAAARKGKRNSRK